MKTFTGKGMQGAPDIRKYTKKTMGCIFNAKTFLYMNLSLSINNDQIIMRLNTLQYNTVRVSVYCSALTQRKPSQRQSLASIPTETRTESRYWSVRRVYSMPMDSNPWMQSKLPCLQKVQAELVRFTVASLLAT